jgi:4-diphosphocytidyl-2-C-methyl-D-erythritol kinase
MSTTHPNVKINLGLNVLRRREDGYHDLDTVFLPYHEIHDTLEIISGDDWSRTSAAMFEIYSPDEVAQGIAPDGSLMITIARRGGVDWDPLDDLTANAYGILKEDFKLPPVKIFLEKTSPVGAGLGGGSADAAFALRMLNEMFSLGLDDERLAEYASRLGSDCAFFIYNRPMSGRGRGEVLCPVDVPLDGYEIKVVVPEGIAVSTREAYSGVTPRVPELPLEDALKRPVGQWKDLVVNDFETSVFAKHPELAAIKQSLYDSGAVFASLSGSGAALFGIYRTIC